MVTDYHFTVEPAAPGTAVAGTLEVVASQWIFPGTPKRLPLEPRHTVTAGMFNTFFEMAVIPDVDVTVRFTGADFADKPKAFSRTFFIIVALLITAIAALIMLALM